jgi:hypothetical protein
VGRIKEMTATRNQSFFRRDHLAVLFSLTGITVLA